mgnify:CR=1 FL=1
MWVSLILKVAAASVLWMATAVAHPLRFEARAAKRSTVPIAVAMHEPLSSCNRVRPGDASNGNVRQVSPVVEHVVETHETCVSLRHILQVSARHKLLVHASCIRNAVALLLSLDNDTHGAGIIQLRAVNRVQAQAHNRARRQLNAAVQCGCPAPHPCCLKLLRLTVYGDTEHTHHERWADHGSRP